MQFEIVAQSAGRIGHRNQIAVGAADVVAFFAEQGVVAIRIHAAGLIGKQLREKALAGHLRNAGDAGDFHQCRREIGEGDEVGHRATGLDPFAPACGEGDVKAIVVDLTFNPGKGHAVIAGDNHDGIQLQYFRCGFIIAVSCRGRH